MKPHRELRWGLCVIAVLAALVTPIGDVEAKKKKSKSARLREQQATILKLFDASKKRFLSNGNLHLVYNFESETDSLTYDWIPSIEKTKSRVRWAREGEGGIFIENGIIVSDFGEWYHKARFLRKVRCDVNVMHVSSFRPGTFLAAVYRDSKTKRSVGTNAGRQFVSLRGRRHACKPMPAKEPKLISNKRLSFGFRLTAKSLESTRRQKPVAKTEESRFLSKSGATGNVGLCWNGSVQSFVFKVVIEGKLDPKWVEQQIGEKMITRDKAKSKTKKKKRKKSKKSSKESRGS